MSEEFGLAARRELERWRIRDAETDWPDVVARAKRRPARRRPSRLSVVVAALAAVALAAPAFALFTERLFGGRSIPVTFNVASVDLGSGRKAILYLRSHGSALVRDADGFHYRQSSADSSRSFHWRLNLRRVRRVDALTIVVDGGPTVRLCENCRARSGGQFDLRSAAALALLNGRATVIAGAHRDRITPAMGGRLFLHSAATGGS